MSSQRQQRQLIGTATLVIYIVALILLGLAPQPQQEDPTEAVLQVVISEQVRQPRGVPVAAAEAPDVTPVVLKPVADLGSKTPVSEPVPPRLQRAFRDPAAPLTGQQLKQARALISQLSGDEPTRQLAEYELLKLGHGTMPLLREAEETPPAEARERIAAVLAKFKQEVPGRGLQITLSANRRELKQGETLILTTVVTNTLTERLNLYIGYSLTGTSLASAEAMHVYSANEKSVQDSKCLLGGLCGTGAGPIFACLPPGESAKYETHLKLQTGLAQWGKGKPVKASRHYGNGWFMLPAPAPGVHRFFVRHAVTTANNQPTFGIRHGKFDPQARYWVGQLVSNEVAVRVTN